MRGDTLERETHNHKKLSQIHNKNNTINLHLVVQFISIKVGKVKDIRNFAANWGLLHEDI